MKRILLILSLLLLGGSPAWAAERTVVYVLFDGFSPAELDAAHPTPNFDRLKREGAWSRHLVPAFPTISLINHTTAYTGCWPEHHGIVSNVFDDPKLGRFGEGDGDAGDAKWRTGCETMWEAAERQGVRAAAFNTVGRWSSKTGPRATYINPEVPWKQHESDDTIIDRALKLLKDNGPNHARLIALYFSIPDSVAHEHGVTGEETQDAVKRADAIAGRLMAAIKALPPGREGTLVIGTDHGMMDVGPLINLGRIMAENDIHADQATDGASAYFYLDKGESVDRVETALKKYPDLFKVYRTGRYPAFAHDGTGPRVGELMVVAHPPYWMAGPELFPWWAKWVGVDWFWPLAFTPMTVQLKATHGYDPDIVQMHGVFYAWGAGVTPGEVKRLDQVDVHPTVMKLLGLQPGRPVDGHAIAAVSAP
ncbi:MAG TPA: ectonucleotide pyrophosphatase/phosphodiesterase [Rhizomicrobium sp.]|nr:ectonucleotide pyrophosphatase/phosphodiesterase [Rhizomicrobium sp.]